MDFKVDETDDNEDESEPSEQDNQEINNFDDQNANGSSYQDIQSHEYAHPHQDYNHDHHYHPEPEPSSVDYTVVNLDSVPVNDPNGSNDMNMLRLAESGIADDNDNENVSDNEQDGMDQQPQFLAYVQDNDDEDSDKVDEKIEQDPHPVDAQMLPLDESSIKPNFEDSEEIEANSMLQKLDEMDINNVNEKIDQFA